MSQGVRDDKCRMLLSLAAGLYKPSAGHVLLDGNDISSLDRSWLVTQVAVVPQEPFLFAGSVWDNIAASRLPPMVAPGLPDGGRSAPRQV